jgi:hypothetical protein
MWRVTDGGVVPAQFQLVATIGWSWVGNFCVVADRWLCRRKADRFAQAIVVEATKSLASALLVFPVQ